jgi:hypothetical protein
LICWTHILTFWWDSRSEIRLWQLNRECEF